MHLFSTGEESATTFYLNTNHKGLSFPDCRFDIKNQSLFQVEENNAGEKTNLNTAYLIDGLVHNRHEMGALIWGGISARLGISKEFLHRTMEGAHQVIEGNGEELNRMNMWRLGRSIYGLGSEKMSPPVEYNVKISVNWYGKITKTKTDGEAPKTNQ